ncbi:MAG: PhzF family phenazine biosynthesis protein [Acidobacteriia bacterium]|nr:PhzF family phenazine biosynthesis protein [Terriglobia bacterium]MBV8905159.1 PhzF family phenazine biosynthesis protein [Terriglobia bacterium]
MGIRIVQVDAFTNRPFAGNPAAVCVLSSAAGEQWMRDVAREMNLSETAFLAPADGGRGSYHLRWFTPSVEVDLCGHATVASAHVLWEDGYLPPDVQARFQTRSGLLLATKSGEWIELDFPATLVAPSEAPAGMLEALGAEAQFVGRSKFDYLIRVASEAVLRTLAPDHAQLRKIPVRGVIVTSRSETPEFDFVSRFFAPGSGIDEDPVTGSAHCALAPYWASELGKSQMTAYQASTRGGVVRVANNGSRVILAGQAVTVLRGEIP